MNTPEIKKMSRIERLQAMEALWDSLTCDEAEIESPEWHRDILPREKKKDRNRQSRIHFSREVEGESQP